MGGEYVYDSVYRRGGRVRVQSSKRQVAGLGDSERGFRGFQIPHLAYQNDVRVLAKGGPQRGSKGMRIRIHLALVHYASLMAVQVFDGVFDRDDVFVAL